MFNYDDSFFSVKEKKSGSGAVISNKLYRNNTGEYNSFFGDYKGWDFSFISNDNSLYTKVFDNVEIRCDHYKMDNDWTLINDISPFTYIEASNEYQNGASYVDSHNMRKKFRIWRTFIPRHQGTMQRIRNPWAMITLGWNPGGVSGDTNKAVIHDVTVKYTV